jgi:asparagine synthase (glutamine-hydrolysing)
MCGIIGGFWKSAPENLDDIFSASLKLLAHRGPDDQGVLITTESYGTLTLGHRRLSIIDLSPAGHQPMYSADGRYVIVFNGEIYNYLELKQELSGLGHTFYTDTDTEVLLVAWDTWGDNCLQKLIGMFSFALFDTVVQTLTCVRDAFGIKPLFYKHTGEVFIFGSELPPLMHLDGEDHQLNRQRAFDFVIHCIQDQGTDTFVKEYHHVPPAHYVEFDLNDPALLRTKRWWTPSIKENTAISFDQAAEKLRELFLDSVRMHLRSDVPLGAALSGGIDSSALVCAMRYLEPHMPIHTFSYIADDERLSEEKWIDIVNNHVNASVHKIYVNQSELIEDLEDIVKVQGEPFGSTNMYAQYRVFKEAHKHGITVVLEGQGADETLAGYEGYAGQRMRSLFEKGNLSAMISFAAAWKKWPGRQSRSAWKALAGQLINDKIFNAALKYTNTGNGPAWMKEDRFTEERILQSPNRPATSKEGRNRRVPEVLTYAISGGNLASLLRYGDRNAMRFSIENRVPFLTLPLVNFLFSLPEHFLVSSDGQTKCVFRAAMRGIVPDVILDRKDKIGFETPMSKWMSAVAPDIKNILRYADKFSFLDTDKMIDTFESSISDTGKWNIQVWRMVNLVWWAKINNLN